MDLSRYIWGGMVKGFILLQVFVISSWALGSTADDLKQAPPAALDGLYDHLEGTDRDHHSPAAECTWYLEADDSKDQLFRARAEPSQHSSCRSHTYHFSIGLVPRLLQVNYAQGGGSPRPRLTLLQLDDIAGYEVLNFDHWHPILISDQEALKGQTKQHLGQGSYALRVDPVAKNEEIALDIYFFRHQQELPLLTDIVDEFEREGSHYLGQPVDASNIAIIFTDIETFSRFGPESRPLLKKIVGVCLGLINGGRIILLDQRRFHKVTVLHELGHCYLGRNHNDGWKNTVRRFIPFMRTRSVMDQGSIGLWGYAESFLFERHRDAYYRELFDRDEIGNFSAYGRPPVEEATDLKQD